ncbi:hypothetical protein SASPL_100291 [Salvia splendens]|uniref:Uncharacterized protein n=1 Tax=Salvia splendens TaxID=180675 RepID=A0A8X9ABG1_SALSN|nr:hypothetical protein SASPL_100291 [Salvia splendens]
MFIPSLADYAEILLSVKETFLGYDSPVIVVGGSIRWKYPHLALGALASSAPVLYFDDMVENGYFSVVTKTTLARAVTKPWDEIDYVASMPGGLVTTLH